MLSQVRVSVTEFALRVSVVNEEEKSRRRNWTETHDEIDMVSAAERQNPGLEATARKTNTIVNTNKVGRNDPCPCGSGKKYKNCCGK